MLPSSCQNLAQHARRLQACHCCQIDSGLGVTQRAAARRRLLRVMEICDPAGLDLPAPISDLAMASIVVARS